MNPKRHSFVAMGVAAVLCPLVLLFQAQLPLPKPFFDPAPHPYSASFVRFASIGYWPAVTDWLWIKNLQLIGSEEHPPELKPIAFRFFELATDLDPRFFDFYEQASAAFGFLFHSPKDAIYFLEKGVQHLKPEWRNSFRLHLMLSYYYGYEMNDWPKCKEHYLAASELTGAPAYLQRMKSWLDQKGSEKELARRILSILISSTENELLKKEYEKKLKQL